MYKYTVLDKQYVLQKLDKGECVLCVDFKTMKIIDCAAMTVSAINIYKESSDTIFYTKAEVTE